ncbi:hypothetical protein ACIGHN_02315 [Acidovorax sp. NPDC077693]|uniref:hypothetical protein n=1 Tax=unclassified Acidovorax TaxID=2684926 RepID=UPI0037C9755A
MTTYEQKKDFPMPSPDIAMEINLPKKYLEGVHFRFYKGSFDDYLASIDPQSISEENVSFHITRTSIRSFTSEAENIQYTYEQNIAHLSIAIKFSDMHHAAERPEHAWYWLFIANKARGILTQIDHYNFLEERLSQRSENARHAALSRHKDTIAMKQKILLILAKRKPDNGWRNFKTALDSIKGEIKTLIDELGITGIQDGVKNQREVGTVIGLFYKWRHNDPDFKKESNQFVKTSRKLRESIRLPRNRADSGQSHLQTVLQLFSQPIKD